MLKDAASEAKSRMRADLRAAMKDGRVVEVNVIRALVAAIDNAEAPPVSGVSARHGVGAAEVERLLLSASQVRNVLSKELDERERAAAEFERLGLSDRAETLRAEAIVARRYLTSNAEP